MWRTNHIIDRIIILMRIIIGIVGTNWKRLVVFPFECIELLLLVVILHIDFSLFIVVENISFLLSNHLFLIFKSIPSMLILLITLK